VIENSIGLKVEGKFKMN